MQPWAVIGSAFCTSTRGIGKWKLVNPYYGFKAIESIGGGGGGGLPSKLVLNGNDLRPLHN